MTDVLDLLSKLEAAEIGDRNLDREVFTALGFRERMDSCPYWVLDSAPNTIVPADREALTTSIDSAVALFKRVRPDWFWSMHENVNGKGHAATIFALNEPPWTGSCYEHMAQVNANTAALAMCAAVLHAAIHTS